MLGEKDAVLDNHKRGDSGNGLQYLWWRGSARQIPGGTGVGRVF